MVRQDKRQKTLVDLREFPRALELARSLYRDNDGHLRQTIECTQIAEILGLSNIAVWHAYQRGDLGVPSPNPARADAWACSEKFYEAEGRPCRQCGGTRRQSGDDMCFDCETRKRQKA